MRSLTGRQGPCKSLRGGLLQGGKHGLIRHHCNIGGRVANFHRVILWFVAFLSFAASAAFPLPSVYQYRSQDYSTAQAACAAYIAYVQPSNPNNTYSVGGVTEYPSYAVCHVNASASGESWVDNVNIGKYTGSCPSGSVQSGSSCTCVSPNVEVNGACETPQLDRDACWNWSGLNTLPGGELVTTQRLQGNIAYDAQFCVSIPSGYGISAGKGCKVTFDKQSAVNYGTDAAPNWVSEGEFDFASNGQTVDQSCTLGPGETPKPAPPKEKCPNGYTGTVNGVEVCVNKRPDSGVGDDTKETEENDGTDTKKTKTDSRTECKNGVCTTTTTTTITTTNNSTGASTTTSNTTVSTQGQKGFCAENPGVKICDTGEDDGSAFGGSCGSGFTCEGDAIQCAIAQEQHRRACKLFDDTSEESQLYQSNKGKEGNQTTNLPGNETVNIAGRIDSSDALGASSAGIADLNVTVLGESITLPFSMLNPYLSALGNLLLAVSFLLALRIVARG